MNNSAPQNFRDIYQATTVDLVNDTNIELASPWARMGAYLLNSLLGLLVIAPILVAMFPLLLDNNPDNFKNSQFLTSFGLGFGITLLLGLALLIWQVMWMSQRGQSIGKRVVGIKVVDLNGQNPGFVGTVLLREVVYALIILVISFVIGSILAGALAMGSALDSIERYSVFFDLIGYLPTIICTIMLFSKKNQRRTLQDYLAKTLVVKA